MPIQTGTHEIEPYSLDWRAHHNIKQSPDLFVRTRYCTSTSVTGRTSMATHFLYCSYQLVVGRKALTFRASHPPPTSYTFSAEVRDTTKYSPNRQHVWPWFARSQHFLSSRPGARTRLRIQDGRGGLRLQRLQYGRVERCGVCPHYTSFLSQHLGRRSSIMKTPHGQTPGTRVPVHRSDMPFIMLSSSPPSVGELSSHKQLHHSPPHYDLPKKHQFRSWPTSTPPHCIWLHCIATLFPLSVP